MMLQVEPQSSWHDITNKPLCAFGRHLKESYPLYTALLSDWRVNDSSPLPYLRELTCELDIGAFLYCKDSNISFVRLACGIAKAGE